MSRPGRSSGALIGSLGTAALVGVGLLSWRLTPAAREARENKRDASCAGLVEWPASSQSQLALRLRFVAIDTGVGLDDLRVRACLATSRCEMPVAETTTRAGGFASLIIDKRALQTKEAASALAFDGFFMVEGGGRHQAQKFWLSAPLLHRQCAVFRLSSDVVSHAIRTSLSAPVVETRAIVEVQVDRGEDLQASDTQLEVWNASGADYQLCADCRVLYPGREGAPSAAQPQLAGARSSAWLVLAPRDALFVARDARTQQVVSAIGPITLMPEPLHLLLAPASAAQLSNLPESIRLGPRLRRP